MYPSSVSVHIERDPEALRTFFRSMGAEEDPGDPAAPQHAEAGLLRSLQASNWLHSEHHWLFLARWDGQPAGYALVVCIPKADERLGFLFVDELYVLPGYRRRGVGQALLAEIQALARKLGLAGVRLLVRPENRPARHLYRKAGFRESAAVFCEWRAV
ncbi:MAG: GNAT family N-acetyltransferase [Chloroflexia bacterium]